MALETLQAFANLRGAQKSLMRSVNEYLNYDLGGIDESAMVLLQATTGFFNACEPGLAFNSLTEIHKTCELILKEHEHVARLMKERDEAHTEFEHYNEKVAQFLAHGVENSASKREKERVDRNREKLLHAQRIADERRKACDDAVRTVVSRRRFHARSSLHATLGAYVRLFAGWGEHAGAVTEAYDRELSIGTPVEVIGLPEQSDLHGAYGVISRIHEDTGQYTLKLSDGSEEDFRPEYLSPTG